MKFSLIFLAMAPAAVSSKLLEADCASGIDYITSCKSGAVMLFTDFKCKKHAEYMKVFEKVDGIFNSSLGVSLCMKTQKPPTFAYANVLKMPKVAEDHEISEVPTIRFFGGASTIREFDDYTGPATECELIAWVEKQIRYFCLVGSIPEKDDGLKQLKVENVVTGTPIVSTENATNGVQVWGVDEGNATAAHN